MRKSQKLAEKSRIEQDERNSPIQENQVRDQIGSGQRKDTRKPHIEQSTNKIENKTERIFLNMYIIHKK